MTRTNWFILATAVLAACVGGYVEHRHRQPDTFVIGQPVSAITLHDLAGKPKNLDDYRGHRLLLNFWASWCAPCLDEMPALDRASKQFGDRGPIVSEPIVIGIAMDDPEQVKAFLVAHPLNYPMLLGDLNEPSTSQQLGDTTEVLPYSVLVGADGRVLATHEGPLATNQISQWLESNNKP